MRNSDESSTAADSAKLNRATPDSGRLWPGLLLAAAVILLCLVAGEMLLRRAFPLDGVILQRDARYLYKQIPNSRRQLALPEGRFLVTINSQGRRGDLLTAHGGLRVMVYGDSYIAALRTPLDQTFVRQLQQLLRTSLSQPVQVINAGVQGYGPDQESLVMEDEIDATRPDLIILAIYSYNDYGDLIRNKLYRLNEQGQLTAGHPQLDAYLSQYFDEAQRKAAEFQVVKRAKRFPSALRSTGIGARIASRLHAGRAPVPAAPRPPVEPSGPSAQDVNSRKLLDSWLPIRQEEYQNLVIEHDNLVHNLFTDTYDVDISLTPRSESAQYKIALMERVIERIQGIASRRSVPLVFLILPSPIDVEDKWDISVDPAIYPEYRRSRLTDILEQIAKEHRLSYLNLFEPFRAHRAENLYFHAEDDHWNSAGQSLAANLMADYIARNHILRETSH